MLRITPDSAYPLHSVESTRLLEERATAVLPSHTLMQRAGLAIANLAQALAPHARTIWVACINGVNGIVAIHGDVATQTPVIQVVVLTATYGYLRSMVLDEPTGVLYATTATGVIAVGTQFQCQEGWACALIPPSCRSVRGRCLGWC